MSEILNSSARRELRSLIDRLETQMQRIDEERECLKEILLEAKGRGYDVPTLRQVLRLRRQDAAKRDQAQALLDLYLTNLGDLPLFELLNPQDGSVSVTLGGAPTP